MSLYHLTSRHYYRARSVERSCDFSSGLVPVWQIPGHLVLEHSPQSRGSKSCSIALSHLDCPRSIKIYHVGQKPPGRLSNLFVTPHGKVTALKLLEALSCYPCRLFLLVSRDYQVDVEVVFVINHDTDQFMANPSSWSFHRLPGNIGVLPYRHIGLCYSRN